MGNLRKDQNDPVPLQMPLALYRRLRAMAAKDKITVWGLIERLLDNPPDRAPAVTWPPRRTDNDE